MFKIARYRDFNKNNKDLNKIINYLKDGNLKSAETKNLLIVIILEQKLIIKIDWYSHFLSMKIKIIYYF